MQDYRNHIEAEFRNYTNSYDADDPKIRLKVDHTYRVASLCDDIARSLGLSERDVEIAWTTGMLHDIGRFEQVKRYGTFSDGQSVDHAQFGADLLFREKLYERFVPENDAEKMELVEKSIRMHNVFMMPENLTGREKIFCNILRDADKIDILRANCETRTEDVYNITTEELRDAEVSEDVKAAFREHRCAKRRPGMTAVDHLTGHVCFTFELVYRRSLELMFAQGYLFRLLDFRSNRESTNEWFSFMKSEMRKFHEGLEKM